MARSLFGGSSADGVYSVFALGGRELLALATATLTFWDAETGGTQHTDLLDSAGAAVTEIVTGLGQVPAFQGPDGIQAMWADDGDTQRALMIDRYSGPQGIQGPAMSDALLAAAVEVGATKTVLRSTYARAMEAARPHTWWKTYRVNQAGTNGAFTTLAAANTQAGIDRAAKLGASNIGNVPAYRILFLVDPGTYPEPILVGNFADVVGSTGNRDDVIFQTTGDVATMNVNGSTFYLAHLTLSLTGFATLTGVHALNGGSGRTPCVGICENVRFVSTSTATNGPNPVNVLAGNAQGYVFYGCDFDAPLTGGPLYQTCEFGNSAISRSAPGFIVCINCTAEAPGASANGGSLVNFHDVALNTQPDVFAWIDGTIAPTVGSPGYQINMINQANGKAAQVFVTPGIIIGGAFDPTVIITAAKFPNLSLPVDGMTDAVRAWFGPRRITAVTTQPRILTVQAPDAVASALVASRWYWVPVELSELLHSNTVAMGVVSPSGKVLVSIHQDDGTGKPGRGLNRGGGTGQALTAAGMFSAFAYTYGGFPGRPVWPGLGRVWLGMAADNAVATFVCSSLLSTMRNVYYQDLAFPGIPSPTATPILVPPGTPVPILSIISN